jgi:hypothetical protein
MSTVFKQFDTKKTYLHLVFGQERGTHELSKNRKI